MEKEKVKDMHISVKENIFYNYDFIGDNDEKSEITIWAGLPVAWWRCGCRLLVYGFVCGFGRTVVRLLFGCGLALRIGRLVAASRLPGGSARAVVPGWVCDLSLDVASVLFGCCSTVVWSCVVAVGLVSGCCAW